MEKWLQEIKEREQKQLDEFLEHALKAINCSGTGHGPLKSITVTRFETFPKVLVVSHKSGLTAYINIDANSVSATARELFKYVYTDNCQGLIETGYISGK